MEGQKGDLEVQNGGFSAFFGSLGIPTFYYFICCEAVLGVFIIMPHFPNDVHTSVWNISNLTMWQDSKVTDLTDRSLSPLEAKALHVIGLLVTGPNETLVTNEETYTLDKLVALRNLAAHGQGVASARRNIISNIFLHIELLDSFPRCLGQAFDDYYQNLLDPSKYTVRENLAKSGLQPIHYSKRPGQAFISPIRYACDNIVDSQKLPSEVLEYKDWQVYK